MRQLFRFWRPMALAAAAALIGASGMLATDSGPASAAKEVHAVAGGGEAGIAVNVYSPASIAVNPGDTVTWTNPYTEPHSVSYDAGDGVEFPADPPVNAGAADAFDGSESFSSGLFASAGMFAANGDSFSVTFEETGIFTFFCTIHPGMEVTVSVVNAANTPAIDEDRVEERIQTGIDLGLAAADALEVPGPTAGPGGTKIWTIPTPPTVPYEGSVVDVLRFKPAEINIGAGDTVTWENSSFTPHTVTFLVGPPPAGFDPFVPDFSSDVYQPGTFVHSGIYVNNALAPVFGGIGDSFSLKFNTPGTYQYICALHADSGMVGVINVGPKGSGSGGGGGGGITPPNTGDAGLLDRSTGSWMMLTGVAMFLLSFGAAFALVRNR